MTDMYWVWFVAAGVLLIFEMGTYSTYALWIAIGAGMTGILSLLFPQMSEIVQLAVFSVFSVVGLFIGYKFFRSDKIQRTNGNILNQRGNQYVDQVYTLEEDIINGRAHLKIEDTLWRIRCNRDIKQGHKVRVVKVDGNKLLVEPYTKPLE